MSFYHLQVLEVKSEKIRQVIRQLKVLIAKKACFLVIKQSEDMSKPGICSCISKYGYTLLR